MSECHKLCDFGEYLDYENLKKKVKKGIRKRLVDKLVEESGENVDEAN